MKRSDNITEIPTTATKFFEVVKEYLKTKSTNKLEIQTVRSYSHSPQESLLGNIMGYIHSKEVSFDKNTSGDEIVRIFKRFLSEVRTGEDKWKISSDGIKYVSNESIVDRASLLKVIEDTPEGLLVDEDLLKFTVPGIHEFVKDLVNSRKVIAVRSKNIDKSKDKENNYEGYYLLPFPPEVKDSLSSIFKLNEENLNLERPKDSREEKMKRIYETKTSHFRKDFESKCSENINKGQEKIGNSNSAQSHHKIFNSWDSTNKNSIPNFEREAEEWFKNRK